MRSLSISLNSSYPQSLVSINYNEPLNLFSYTIQCGLSSYSERRNSDSDDLSIAMANANGRRLNPSLLSRCFGITVELDNC